jgi:hypothetical protein
LGAPQNLGDYITGYKLVQTLFSCPVQALHVIDDANLRFATREWSMDFGSKLGAGGATDIVVLRHMAQSIQALIGYLFGGAVVSSPLTLLQPTHTV